MGGGTFDAGAYRTFSASTKGKTTDQVYTSRAMHKTLDPMGVKLRESRDSADNPNSTPIAVALDVTGSMGQLADVIARQGLGTLFQGILDRKPVTDPHLMFMGIGDVHMGDSAPLQVSQFEADNRIVEQLTNLYIEHGGGNNGSESYHLAWYFAGFHIAHDSIEKRGKRGYLFTVGDEGVPPPLSKDEIKRVTGDIVETDFDARTLLELAQRKCDVYHIIVKEGYAGSCLDRVRHDWAALLGEKVIVMDDHTKLAEIIVSAIEVAEGVDAADSAGRWGSGRAQIVHDAVKNLPRGRATPMLGGPR